MNTGQSIATVVEQQVSRCVVNTLSESDRVQITHYSDGTVALGCRDSSSFTVVILSAEQARAVAQALHV